MRKFLVTSATVLLSGILLAGVLMHTSDARSATTCAEGLPQQSEVRCTRMSAGKHKPMKIKPEEKKQIFGGLPTCFRMLSSSQQSGMFPNTPPTVELRVSVEKITLSCKSGETPTVCPSDAKVQLNTVASDAEGDALLYEYIATVGRISQDGGTDAVWDLSGVEAGDYKVNLEVQDGCGCLVMTNATVSVVACPDCKSQ